MSKRDILTLASFRKQAEPEFDPNDYVDGATIADACKKLRRTCLFRDRLVYLSMTAGDWIVSVGPPRKAAARVAKVGMFGGTVKLPELAKAVQDCAARIVESVTGRRAVLA